MHSASVHVHGQRTQVGATNGYKEQVERSTGGSGPRGKVATLVFLASVAPLPECLHGSRMPAPKSLRA